MPMTLVIRVGPMPEPDAGAAGGGRGGGDERVGAVVHVEHGRLGAFEQHGPALVEGAVEHEGGVGDVGPHPLAVAEVFGHHGGRVDAAPVVDLRQDLVLLHQHQGQLLLQDAGVEQVLDPDPGPRHLVAVGRPDAPAGGPDAGAAQVAFGHLVECPVVGHDQVRVGRDEQPVAGHAALGEAVDLGQQDLGVDDHAVADDRRDLGGQHPRGQQVERVALVPDDHRVAGVVAALVPDHVVDAVAQQVGRLALALITPLRAHQHNGRHQTSPFPAPPRASRGYSTGIRRG